MLIVKPIYSQTGFFPVNETDPNEQFVLAIGKSHTAELYRNGRVEVREMDIVQRDNYIDNVSAGLWGIIADIRFPENAEVTAVG